MIGNHCTFASVACYRQIREGHKVGDGRILFHLLKKNRYRDTEANGKQFEEQNGNPSLLGGEGLKCLFQRSEVGIKL